MIRQFQAGKEPKKMSPSDARRGKTGSEESHPVIDTSFEDIDPADFFDPEEFGFRREAKPYEP